MKNLALIATTVDTHGARALARSDCAAAQSALLGDKSAIAVTPTGDRSTNEYALAAGFRSILALDASPPNDFNIAYVGSGLVELVGDVFLARWAEMSKATLLFDVLKCSDRGGGIREIESDACRGARHIITVYGPLILVLSSHVARPAYVSRYRRLVAAQSSVSSISVEHYNQLPEHQWGPLRPRVRVRRETDDSAADDRLNSAFSIQATAQRESSNLIVADPETCARQLLRYLAHHSFVTRPIPDGDFSSPEIREHTETKPASPTSNESPRVLELGSFRERRPRQTADSSLRLTRQPRPLGTLVPLNDTLTLTAFKARRPRLGNESMTRRARQPRPMKED